MVAREIKRLKLLFARFKLFFRLELLIGTVPPRLSLVIWHIYHICSILTSIYSLQSEFSNLKKECDAIRQELSTKSEDCENMAKRSLAEYEKLQSDKQAMINQLNGKLFAIMSLVLFHFLSNCDINTPKDLAKFLS